MCQPVAISECLPICLFCCLPVCLSTYLPVFSFRTSAIWIFAILPFHISASVQFPHICYLNICHSAFPHICQCSVSAHLLFEYLTVFLSASLPVCSFRIFASLQFPNIYAYLPMRLSLFKSVWLFIKKV